MGGRLFIAEKPAVAAAIAEAMGGGSRQQGFIQVGSDRVTWCIGHLLRLLEPHEYDERYGQWRMEDLPIVHTPWKWGPGGDAGTKAQLKIVIGLLKETDVVVHCGDPDDEGQLIVDSVVEYAKCKKPVKRVLINDNNVSVVKKAIDSMEDNALHYPMGRRAEARTVGDQIYGINMTRAYTLCARMIGFQDVLHIGRVANAILGMVVRRDRANEGHEKINYYQVKGTFDLAGMKGLPARYKVQPTDPVGDNKELSDPSFAGAIVESVRGQAAVVVKAQTLSKEKQPPLPYNLLKLQAEASGKFSITPKEVMAITQELKDKHRLITYNRSDCQYLSDEQHEAAPAVLAAIGKTAPYLTKAAEAANPAVKSRAFDSSKVSAHHGIVPTATTANFAALSDKEQKLYLLIARAYIAQFFPPQEYDTTKVSIECGGHTFETSSRVVTRPGWQALYRNDGENDDTKLEDVDCSEDLSRLVAGETGTCTKAVADAKETQPPKRYTIKTLLLDLPRAAKYIRDTELRKLLVERDKGKEGESGGIGTPATRDAHLDNLFTREYLRADGDKVISTALARDYYDLLPDEAKYPDLSAMWEEKFQLIEAGRMTPQQFVEELEEKMATAIERLKVEGVKLKVDVFSCPNCSKPLRRISKGQNGPFWVCPDDIGGCKSFYTDQAGKPCLTSYPCPDCEKPLRRRTGEKGAFWGCTAYPVCNVTLPDDSGKPGKKKVTAEASDFACAKCSKSLVHRFKKGAYDFFSCSDKTCKTTYQNKSGKPDYGTAK